MGKKALVVGINNYPGVNRLEGCVNDAKEVADLLARNEDGSTNFDVKSILVEKPDAGVMGAIPSLSRNKLLEEIKRLFSEDNEIALFYFSGHGTTIDVSGEYICTTDICDCNPGVNLTEISNIISRSKCKNKIVILDSCFSGGMGLNPLFSKDAAVLQNGVTILSACTAYEVAKEKLFTSLLVQALKGGAADLQGNITLGSVYAFIDKTLGTWEQRPLFKTNVNEFVSLRKAKAPIELADLQKLKDVFSHGNGIKLDPSFEYTNTPEINHDIREPYANPDNVKTFKLLQKYERVGLVEPVGEQHMYYAAINSKSCKLTALGEYYLMLVKRGRL